MQTIELATLVAVTGGTQTVAGAKKLDTATQTALTQLASDVKDLARPTQNQQSQLMTMLFMTRLLGR